MLKQAFAVLLSLYLFIGISPSFIQAATYGGNNYGNGIYNVGTASSGNSSSSSSSSGSPSAPGCNERAPDSIPDLFQINSKPTSLTLFFTPSAGNRDRYYVSYGTKSGDYKYGFEFMNGQNGVISVDVGALKKNTTYYFKVRAGHGCQPGGWSNELSARTGQQIPSYRWHSFSKIVSNALHYSTVSNVHVDGSKNPPLPAKPDIQAPTNKRPVIETVQPTPVTVNENIQPVSIWQRFRNLFQ